MFDFLSQRCCVGLFLSREHNHNDSENASSHLSIIGVGEGFCEGGQRHMFMPCPNSMWDDFDPEQQNQMVHGDKMSGEVLH